MNIPIDLRLLIDLAARKAGSLGALAEEMGIHQGRLSEWKKGKYHPAAGTIAFLAKRAELPVLETVAEIESQLDTASAGIWQEALAKLRSAGIAAGVLLVIGISGTPTNSQANQRLDSRADNSSAIYIVMH